MRRIVFATNTGTHRPGVIGLHWTDEEEDPAQHAHSSAALEYLLSERDANGQPLSVVKVLAPRGLIRTEFECSDMGLGRETGDVVRFSLSVLLLLQILLLRRLRQLLC